MVRNWYGCCLWGEVHLGQRRGTKEPSGMMEMLYILVWMGLRAHTQNFNKLYKIKIHILGCTVRNNSMKLLKTLLSPDCPVSPSFPPGRFAAQGMTFPSLLGKQVWPCDQKSGHQDHNRINIWHFSVCPLKRRDLYSPCSSPTNCWLVMQSHTRKPSLTIWMRGKPGNHRATKQEKMLDGP